MLTGHVDVVIEVPKGGRVKRSPDGRIEALSPLGCPFNYGYVPDRISGDGDPLDAILLGPPHPRGHRDRARIWGVVRFVDAGQSDDKLLCSPHPPTRLERLRVVTFFRLYGSAKAALNWARGRPGPTRMLGYEAAP